MAPKLRHMHNEVEEVAAKFPQYRTYINEGVIQKTNEELRVLEAKASIGSLDGKNDGRDVRAAILLECVVRETTGFRLPLKELAKGMCRKREKFSKLHNIVANLRNTSLNGNGSSRARNTNSSSKNSNRPSSLPHATSARNSESSLAESTIPRLSLRLNSLIQDPNGYAVKAEKLMKDVSSYVDTLTRTAKRRQEREEIDSHKSAYEAACFFHVVNVTQPKTTTRTKQQLSNTKQQGNDDECGCRSLEIEDILNACPDWTETQFKQILKHLEQLAVEVDDAYSQTAAKKGPTKTTVQSSTDPKKSGTKKSEGRKRNDTSTSGNGAASKKAKEAIVADNWRATTAKVETKRNDHSWHDFEHEMPSLHEWRLQTLANAKMSAKEALHKDTGKSPQSISDSDALQHAADEILRKFGLEFMLT